jgi:hypothetical protein
MPLPTVTAQDLQARYTAFADADVALIGLLLDEAKGAVDDTWIEADQKPALLAYAAHLLALEQADDYTASDGNGGTIQVTGPLESIEVGDVKTKFAHVFLSEAAKAAASSAGGLSSTPYGRRYLQLLRRSKPAILVL